MLRKQLAALTTLVALFALVPSALAGGWAVVTLDELPAQVRQGQSLQLGFMVRQHGQTPTNAVQPYLEARNLETGESVRVEARQQGPVGHFVLEVTFPAAGSWEWSIVPAPFAGTPLPTVRVLPAAPAQSNPAVAAPQVGSMRSALRWAGLALLLTAGGVGVYARLGARQAARAGAAPTARVPRES